MLPENIAVIIDFTVTRFVEMGIKKRLRLHGPFLRYCHRICLAVHYLPKRFLPARNPMTSCDKRHVIYKLSAVAKEREGFLFHG